MKRYILFVFILSFLISSVQAQVSVNPDILNFDTSNTGNTFNIINENRTSISWIIEKENNSTWITSLKPDTIGMTAGNDSSTITVEVDPNTTRGTYEDNLIIYENETPLTAEYGRVAVIMVVPNHPPQIENEFADFKLEYPPPGSDRTFNLVSTDQDEDPLTYTAETSDSSIATAETKEATLTVTAQSSGTAMITVSVNDGHGGSDSKSFYVEVNFPPTIEKNIPDTTLTVDDRSDKNIYELTLNEYFEDKDDGNNLSYTVESTSQSVSIDLIESHTCRIKALTKNDTAIITVTADDHWGGTVENTFKVAVINSPPYEKNVVQDFKLRYSNPPNDTVQINLDKVFFDPDNDQLSYTAKSYYDSVATVNTRDSILTVTADSSGETIVKIKATDNDGGIDSASFKVTVNSLPYVENPVDSIIHLTVGSPGFEANLDRVFADPDKEDSLIYSAESADESIAIVAISAGYKLFVSLTKPETRDSTSITVVANDSFGGLVTLSIPIKVNFPPEVKKPISDTYLTVNFRDSLVQNLNTVFTDIDHDALSYKVISSNPSVASAYIMPDSITLFVKLVENKASGANTDIIITASDRKGGLNSLKYKITVNFPPKVKRSIPDTILTLGSSVLQQNLNKIFTDDDKDTLSFMANSYDESIAIASISSDSLLLVSLTNPSSRDTVRITVKAGDQKGGFDSTSFKVSIANSPPLHIFIHDKILTVGNPDFEQNLNTIFTDPDGDSLFYKVFSADDSVATAYLREDSVRLVVELNENLDPGDLTHIYIIADDKKEGLDSTSFVVKVNFPPEVITSIRDTSLASGQKYEMNLRKVFFDCDNDKLSYRPGRPGSSDTTIATIEIKNDSVLVVMMKTGITGSALITVEADDHKGGMVSTDFNVIVDRPPTIKILEEVIQNAIENKDFSILANITDINEIESVILKFRCGGDSAFIDSTMQLLGEKYKNIYKCRIPGEFVTNRGIEYNITATDKNNLSDSTGLQFLQVFVPEGIKSGFQPAQVYRLFSVPLKLNNPNVEGVLEDDLGKYDKHYWRFFEYVDESTPPLEYPNTSDLQPHKAFWLIVKDGKDFIDTGAGYTVNTTQKYSIGLNPGWNDIGNPFNFPIRVHKLNLKSDQTLNVQYYNSGNWEQTADYLQPFEGYAVANNTNSTDSLYIDPQLYPLPDRMLSKVITSINEEDFLWMIKIQANCQQALDLDNVAAVAKIASTDWDKMDLPEPPAIWDYVSVSFPHFDWEKPLKLYSTDVRPEPVNGEIWEFFVRTNINDKINLTFKEMDQVPEQFEIWLVDEKLYVTQNLREKNTYYVAGSNANYPKFLKLIVGNCNFIEEKLAEVTVIPKTFELCHNFPNPFNPSTTIKYGLPRDEEITLKIFNMLGQEVATLIDKEIMPAGYHAVVWDGRNEQGIIVANGIYLCHFHSGSIVLLRKMVFMK
jgi:hypothetical protein